MKDPLGARRQSLEARLQNRATAGGIDLQRLRRQAAVERLLVRLEHAHPGRWVLKGGMALEFRLGDRARTTRDLDLALRDGPTDAADVRDLVIEAASRDPDGDGFEFRVGAASSLRADEAGRPGWRLPLEARLAGRVFAQFRVDVVARAEELQDTERLQLPGALGFAGIATTDVEAASPAQQFAEKLHALTRTYAGDRPSTRVRDLPDLILLIENGLAPDSSLAHLVERVFAIRATHPVPDQLPDPPASWSGPYAAMAADLDIGAPAVADAMRLLRDFWQSTTDPQPER